MIDNVIDGNFATTLDLPPEKVLEAAKMAGLTEVIIIGRDLNGFYIATSMSSLPDIMWSLKSAEYKIVRDYAET